MSKTIKRYMKKREYVTQCPKKQQLVEASPR